MVDRIVQPKSGDDEQFSSVRFSNQKVSCGEGQAWDADFRPACGY
jgi:hypothetical protein